MPWSEHQQLPACLETWLFRAVIVLRHCVETFVSLATTWLAQAIVGILSQPVAILCWTTYTTLMYPFSASARLIVHSLKGLEDRGSLKLRQKTKGQRKQSWMVEIIILVEILFGEPLGMFMQYFRTWIFFYHQCSNHNFFQIEFAQESLVEQAFAWCTDIDFCFIDLSQRAAELE